MKKTIQKVILILFSLTPLFTLVELAEFLNLSLDIPMMFLKLPKDILIISICFLSIIYFLVKRKYPIKYYIFLLYITAFTIFCCLISNNLEIILSGIRWALPLFLSLLLYDIIDKILITKLSKILFILIIINIILQICEMFYMPPFWGYNFLGYSGRLPGFFVHPSASGTFSAYCFYCFRYFLEGRIRSVGITLSILGVLLSMSSTAVMLIIILIFIPIYYKSNIKPLILFTGSILFIIAIFNLDTLTGRNEGDSYLSGTTRLEILENVAKSSELVSSKFGTATNFAMNFAKDDNNNAFIADSLYTSVLVNYGIAFFVGFIGFIFYLLKHAIEIGVKDISFITFILICIISGIPIITLELFPINMITAIFLTFFAKKIALYK